MPASQHCSTYPFKNFNRQMKAIISSFLFYWFLVFPISYAVATAERPGKNRGWKAGVSRAVITPEGSMWMSGYSSRDRPAEGILHDLWAKALVLEDGDGKRAVMIATD